MNVGETAGEGVSTKKVGVPPVGAGVPVKVADGLGDGRTVSVADGCVGGGEAGS